MDFFRRKDTTTAGDEDEASTERTSSTKDIQEEEEAETVDKNTYTNVTTYVVPQKQQSSVELDGGEEPATTTNVTTYVVPKKKPPSVKDGITTVYMSPEEKEYLHHGAPVMMVREGDGYVMYYLPADGEQEVPTDVQRQVDGCWCRGPLARVEGYYDSYHCVAEWFFKIACAFLVLYLAFPTWYFHSLAFTFFALTLYNEFSCVLDMDASHEKRHWSSIYSCWLPFGVGVVFYGISCIPFRGFSTDIAIKVDAYVFFFLGLYLTAALLLSRVVYWFHDHRFLAALIHYGPIILGMYLINTNHHVEWGVGCILFEMVFGAALSIVPTWKSAFSPGFHEHIFHSAGPTTIFCNFLLILYLPLLSMGVATYVFIIRCVGYTFMGMIPFTYVLWKQNPLAGEFLGLHADFFKPAGFKRGILTLLMGLWIMIEHTVSSVIYFFRFSLYRGCNSIRSFLVLIGNFIEGFLSLVNKIAEITVWFIGQLVWETCCMFYAIFKGIALSLEAFFMCLEVISDNTSGNETVNDLGVLRPAYKAIPPELPYIPPKPLKPLTVLEQYEVNMAKFVSIYGQEVADVAVEISHDLPRKPKIKHPSQIIAEGGTREKKREAKKIWKDYDHRKSEFSRWYGHIYGEEMTAAVQNAPEMPASLLYGQLYIAGEEMKEGEEEMYSSLKAEEEADMHAMEKYHVDLEEWINLYDPPICSCVGFQMKVTDKVVFSLLYLVYVVRSVFEYIIGAIGFMIRGGMFTGINSVRDVIGLVGKLFQCIFKAFYDLIVGIFWAIGQILWGIVIVFYDLAMGIYTLCRLMVDGIFSCFSHTQENCFYPCYPYGNTYDAIAAFFGFIIDSIVSFFICVWNIVYTVITAPFICVTNMNYS